MGQPLVDILKKYKFALIIFSLAALGRLLYITFLPPALNWDEVSHGYNAYSILKTSKDEWGQTLPLIFRAYGDYKLPVYIYALVPSIAIFGLNAFGVRAPSALAGVLVVVFTYLLVKKLFDQKAALISAFLVAVEPWSLFLSRGAFEANLALAFIVSGVYFFVSALKKPGNLLISVVLLGLSVWTYNSARIFVPLFLLVLLVIYRKEVKEIFANKKKLVLGVVGIAALFFIPMFWQLANPEGQARYGKVAIIDEGAIAQIEEQRNKSGLSGGLEVLVYNKPVYFAQKFIANWLSYFSADFLFFEGGTNFQFSLPGQGLIYPINAVFLVVGILYLLKRRDKSDVLVLAWFYLGPIAASLTRDVPHVLRSITMLPTPMILSAIGLVVAIRWLKGKLKMFSATFLFVIYVALVALSVENWAKIYFTQYRSAYSWSWQYGYKQAVEYAKANYQKYDKIIISKKYGEPHEFFLFFWPWDPRSYQNDSNLTRYYQSGWYWVDSFDKFYFVNDWDIPDNFDDDFVLESGKLVQCQVSNLKCLLITGPDNFPLGWEKLNTINFLDGKPAFEIYEN